MGKQQVVFPKDEPRLTQQNAKDECDINIIVAKAKQGADLSQQMRTPMFGDFTNLPSYRESLLLVNKARDAFMALDAEVRKRFGNDPAQLLDFVADSKNRDEAIKLGLIEAPKGPTPEDPMLSEIKGLRKDISDSKRRKGGSPAEGGE